MKSYTLHQIADFLEATLQGDGSLSVNGVSSLDDSKPRTLTFLSGEKHRKYLENTQAAAVLITQSEVQYNPVISIICDNPYLAFAKITSLFVPEFSQTSIHPSAVIEDNAVLGNNSAIAANCYIGKGVVIGEGVVIGAGCSIGDNSIIGADSQLYANVSIYHNVKIGSNCIIHSGAVIGSDGFGFANQSDQWIKIHHLGGVTIGNNVEIGANTCIDRGAINDTVIADGVKLDNLIQIAHNVKIGKDSALAGCVGIAGSAELGERVAVGGAVTILGHLSIHDDVMITAHSLVTNSIRESGVFSSGTPLQPKKEWQKNYIRFKQLDQMSKKLKALEAELEEIKKNK
jgi:UDP-3-O-[3-hydroxymyristoyl] glucosamine N-acyltransferase